MISPLRVFICVLTCLLFFGVGSALAQRINVFASFEDQAQVEAVETSEEVLLRQSSRFPVWGDNSMEVAYPVAGGRIALNSIPTDWRRSEALLAFVWSEQPAQLDLVFTDSNGSSFFKTFPLKTGGNHIQVKLERASSLALGKMRSIELVSRGPGRFYMDMFALDRFHPIIEERGRWDVDYTMKVETSHFPWGRPLDGGPIKAYILAPVAEGRGVIELAQRLELNLKATTIGRRAGTNMYGFGDFYTQRRGGGSGFTMAYTYLADDLMNGPDYDVILWPSVHPWNDFPLEVRESIRKRVEAGAGLVLFYPSSRTEDGSGLWEISPLKMQRGGGQRGDLSKWRTTQEHYITRNVPFDAFPWGQIGVDRCEPAGQVLLQTEQGTPILAVKKLGKGRVVAFSYTEGGMIPRLENIWETGLHYPYHEYMWSLVARAVVWAAGREPEAKIVQMIRSKKGVKVRLDAAVENCNLLARLMDSFGNIEKEIDQDVPRGKNEATLALPTPLSAGRHFVDLRLVSDDRVLDWAALIIEEASRVNIHSITLDSDRVQLGEKISGRIKLTADKKSKCLVKVRLFDNYGRLVDQQVREISVTGQAETSFSFSSSGVLSHLAKIDCEIETGGLVQDRRISEVFVLQPRVWDDYDIVMYLFGPNPIPGIWPTIDRQLQRLNVTTLSSYPISLCKNANYNVQAQTGISGQESPDGARRNYYNAMKKKYAQTKDKMVLIREYCLHDPEYRQLIARQLKNRVEPWVPFSPLSYYVYEEPSFTCYGDALDICFSQHSLEAMRQWLKDEYGSLEALNAQWGTRFTAWEEVIPDDTYEARARGNYASWADHRTFMEISYADCYRYVLEELHKLDPQGILLNSGTQISGSHNGCDYSRMNLYTRHLNAYTGGNQLDFHRCFNPELKISGGTGYGVYGKSVLYNLYRQLFQGCNGGAYIFWQYSCLDPDLTLCGSGRDMVVGLQEMLGDGIGKLVGLAVPDNHGIAIHYSYPSIHGAWIVDGEISERVSYNTSKTFNRFNAVRDGWVKTLKDSGLQFDFIAYSAVEKGELLSKRYKTFVLPMSIALSEEEVEAIRAFVEQGGTLIADALPGVMDQHCTFRKNRVLQDVFGVQLAQAAREDVIAMNGEPKLKLKGARAMAEQADRPILLHNRYGRGQAFLLNYFPDSYPRDKLEGRALPWLEKMAKVLDAAGIEPKMRLTTLGGEPVTDCERYLFNNGTTGLIGLVPDMGMKEAKKVRISLPQRASVYDVREKRYLGTGTAFETEIEPGVPRLFATVASRLGALALDAPESAGLGEEIKIGLRVEGVENLSSVARVMVTDPTGRQLRYYSGNRDIESSSGSTGFRTALNDPQGDWVVEITEVMSGESVRAVISIN